jgi:hypothetical protein
MKGFALAVVFLIAFPLAAFAHSTCHICQPYVNSDGTLIAPVPGSSPPGLPYIGSLNNSGGTLTGTNAGFTLTGSDLTEVRGIVGADLGTVTLTTGGLAFGSLQTGGWFYPGGSLTITVNPNVLGGPLSGGGILFSGSFAFPLISWSPEYTPGLYLLKGMAYGTLPNGTIGQAFVAEFYYGSISSNGVFTGTMGGGVILVNPEPGTIGLFVTGLIGMGGAIRRKMSF